MLLSTAAQLGVLGLVVVVPVLFVTGGLPEPPTMMAFVAAPPPPPPPPPPAAPAQPAKKVEAAATAPTVGHFAAPIEAPATVTPEPAGKDEDAVGVPGGVEGGVPGGVVGGVVGGLPEAPPPPPPAPAAPSAPVRIGGKVQPPRLIDRVEPSYPPMAVSAHLQGIVILEAIVNEEGRVTEVKVLRSVNPLLDKEALNAVRQWRYAPVILNGTPVKFVLSVSLSFSLQNHS
jgi:protein TonB